MSEAPSSDRQRNRPPRSTQTTLPCLSVHACATTPPARRTVSGLVNAGHPASLTPASFDRAAQPDKPAATISTPRRTASPGCPARQSRRIQGLFTCGTSPTQGQPTPRYYATRPLARWRFQFCVDELVAKPVTPRFLARIAVADTGETRSVDRPEAHPDTARTRVDLAVRQIEHAEPCARITNRRHRARMCGLHEGLVRQALEGLLVVVVRHHAGLHHLREAHAHQFLARIRPIRGSGRATPTVGAD